MIQNPISGQKGPGTQKTTHLMLPRSWFCCFLVLSALDAYKNEVKYYLTTYGYGHENEHKN
jgi:hypothetical protein